MKKIKFVKSDELTKVEKEILDCVVDFIDLKGYSPTVREICKISGRTSPATIQDHLVALKKKGYVVWEPKQMRTLRVLDRG